MVQLMVKFTGTITFAFTLPVNFNSKIDSRVTLGFILPVKFWFYWNYNSGVYFTGKIEALLLE